MGAFACLSMNDPFFINTIDPYFSRCMNNLFGVKKDTYMNDLFFIIKKSQVAANGFFQFLHGLSLLCLLPCVAKKIDSHHFVVDLDKTAAIYTKYRTPTPQIRSIEPWIGQLLNY